MEQKMITVPFEAERAKRIQAGKEPAEIVTRDGCRARVICWDRENVFYPIVALVRDADSPSETVYSVGLDGTVYKGETSDNDLVILVPEGKQRKFEPFQKVLVRFGDDCTWEASLFSHLCDKEDEPFCTVGGIEYGQCIPYNEETKHLIGTSKSWEGEI